MISRLLKTANNLLLTFVILASLLLNVSGETWYPLVSGDWDDPAIWTLDPSGALPDNPGNFTPTTSPTSATDNVVILLGRTVTIQPGNDNKSNAILTVSGRLDFTLTTGHSFSEIRGGGKILLSADNFPAGDSTHFVTGGQGEGTVIYYGNSYNLDSARTFYNLKIDLDDPVNTVTLLADYQVNGSLTVTSGMLRINDNSGTTRLNLTVDGDVLVSDEGAISVGTADAYSAAAAAGYGNFHKGYHIFTVNGDFTNYGNVRLTNQAVPDYQNRTTTGAVSLVFTGAQNNTFQCYDTTDLYILVINKGTDQTYELALYAQDISYFGLFCTNDDAMDATVPAHPENRKALWIQAGTLRLTGELLIPSLTEGGNDFAIGENARFILDGENVEAYSTTTTAFDFSGLSYSTPNGIQNGTANQGTYLFGDFIINDGFYSSSNSSGMCYRDEAAGSLKVNGGEISLTQLRISGFASTGYYSYSQTGGITRIRGNGEIKHVDPIFGLVDPDMTFTMTGGQLIINETSNAGAIRIESTYDKIYVSGGELIIDYNNTSTIYSTAPFYNLDILTGSNVDLLYPFTVLNDFILGSGVTFDHDGFNVTIGGDFTINAGATYVYDSGEPNTTTINGNDDSQLAFYNISGANEQFFWRMVINKPQDRVVSFASSKAGADLEGTSNVLLHIDGDAFILQSGIVNQGFHSIRFNIDTLINYGTLGIYDPASATPDATSNGNNDLVYFNSDPFELFTVDNSKFGNVRLNSEDQIITLNSDVYIERLDWGHGRIDLNTHNLKLDELYVNLDPAETVGGQPSVEDMFITTGNASDGGLTIYIPATGIDPTEGDNVFELPVGIGLDGVDFTMGGNSKYTPCLVTISNVTDDGYITVNPVDAILPTTNQSGNVLSYYWRVRHSDFSSLPTVVYQYSYYEDDTDGANDNVFVPGKVLDESPYTRSSEDLADLDEVSNIINFNGSGSGLTLEKANYTGGEIARFTGQVLIYYTRDHGPDVGIAAREPRWRDRETWTRSDLLIDANGDGPIDEKDWHDSRQPAIPAGDPEGEWPTAGHVVAIGWVPWDDPKVALRGQPHGVWVDNATESCAEVSFTQMKDISGNPVPRYYRSNFQFRPTLCINWTNGNLNAGLVRGEGMFWNRNSDPNMNLMDLGEFISEDSAYIVYESWAHPNTLVNTPSDAPNIIVATDGWSANDKDLTIANDITAHGNFEILGDVNLVLNNGATGNITAMRDLKMVEFDGAESPPSGGGAELAFSNTGTARTITVYGDININNTAGVVHVRAPNGGIVNHNIEVYGDIIQNSAGAGTDGLQLFTAINQDRITLSLLGDDNMDFDLLSGDTPTLYRLIVDKGSDQSVTATINTDFNLGGATSGIGVPKALELQNGTLILNNSGIDIDLSTGDDNFVIPGTTCLEVQDGVVNVSGNNSGISLDGKLLVSGGTVNMYDLVGNGNNYIEYSASGNAEIEITSGNLYVGSQIRRSPTIDVATLKYNQSGGTVNVGMAAAPVNNRGLFEVLGLGSEFILSGGDLLISRQQVSPLIAALYLDPETWSLSSSSKISIGSNLTPVNQNIGIYSSIPVKNLVIDNSSTNDPVAELWSLPLSIEEDLIIQSGAEFNAMGYRVIISGDLTNNGTYTPTGNTTEFNGAGNQTITGNTAFYNLTKSTANTLNLAAGNAEITVQNLLAFQDGTLRDSSNTVNVQGYCQFNGIHIHSGAGDGIKLNGTIQQELTGDGIFGKLTIDNNYGIIVPPGNEFSITDTLKMDGGLFDIGKNLLKLGLNAVIEEATPFSSNNMIQTNISFTDNGVQKTFPAGASTFIYPMGSGGKYTPVTFTVTDNGNNTGTIIVKPANEMHPSIVEDSESPDPEIVDADNVLQYHWVLKSSGMSGFSATAEMKYDPADVEVTAPYDVYDYITARLLSDASGNWNLFDDVNTFDETNELLIFDFAAVDDDQISGDYTAGVAGAAFNGAIPDSVPVYETNSSGNWETGTIWTPNVAGGPRGSIVLINSGHTVTTTTNNKLLYSTEIEGTLQINNTFGHRLGIVTGTGTLYTEREAIPAGIYDEFFSATGGTLEHGGSTDYDVLGSIYELNNLSFSGTGERRLSDADILLYGDLAINGGAALEVINDYDREIEIRGDFTRISGIFEAGTGANASVLLSGVVNQNISGDFTAASALNILEIDNNNGVTLAGDVDIEDELILTSGAITTSGNTLRVELNATVSPASATGTIYINGALTKELISGNDFNFPVGKNTNPGNIQVSDAGGYAGTGDWSAEYFFTNPTLDGYDVTLFAAPVATVSQTEYWSVSAPAGGEGKLVITLDGSSDVANAASDLDSLLIAAWDGAQWVQVGGDPVIAGTATSGTVTAETNIDFDTYSIFTLALEETVSIATASIISGDATICDGESTDILVALTGVAPWSVTYTDGITPQTDNGIMASPHTISVSPSLTTTYTLTAATDNNGPANLVGDIDALITVNPAPTITFTNSSTGDEICDGETVIFTAGGGSNYNFHLNDGSVQDGAFTNYINSALVHNDEIYVVVTGGNGCSDTSSTTIMTVNALPTPGIAGNDTICQGVTEIYTTEAGMSNYDWEVSAGGTIAGGGDGNDFITITWDDVEDQTVSVNYEDVNGCTAASSTVLDIWVHKLPDTGPGYHIENEFDP